MNDESPSIAPNNDNNGLHIFSYSASFDSHSGSRKGSRRRCPGRYSSHAKSEAAQVEGAIVSRKQIILFIMFSLIAVRTHIKILAICCSKFPEVTHKVYLDVGKQLHQFIVLILHCVSPMLTLATSINSVINEEEPIKGRITIGLFGKAVSYVCYI